MACRAQGAGWGTGSRFSLPGWWIDIAAPAAFGSAEYGTWLDSPGGSAPT